MIHFSLKSKYAISALLNLASSDSAQTVKILSLNTKIPLSFLEQIMTTLKKADLVHSIRGSQGGYRLARSAKEIKILDILLALEGPLKISQGFCGNSTLHKYWTDIETHIQALFEDSLDILVQYQQEKALMYAI
jgi:Rrf2 family iron-sulfur cluster assembly transcriptional regulator